MTDADDKGEAMSDTNMPPAPLGGEISQSFDLFMLRWPGIEKMSGTMICNMRTAWGEAIRWQRAQATESEIAAPAVTVPSGWKLVPIEPTSAMRISGAQRLRREADEGKHEAYGRAFDCWDAMVFAAPAPDQAPRSATRDTIAVPRALAMRLWAFLAQDCTPCAEKDCQIDGKNTNVEALTDELNALLTAPKAAPPEERDTISGLHGQGQP